MQLPPQIQSLLDKWLNHQSLTADEEALLRAEVPWFEALTTASALPLPPAFSEEEAWEAFQQLKNSRPAMVPEARVKPLFSRPVWISVAAAIALLVMMGWWVMPQWVTYEAPHGATFSALLPDSSSVTLNAGSVLEFDKKGWSSHRNVALEGEAFFEVKPGSRFEVVTPLGTVEVVGTAFNVRVRDGMMEVACSHGVVLLKDKKHPPVRVEAGWAANISATGISEAYSCPPDRVAQWREGEFLFDKTPLDFVFSELERQFNIEVEGDWGVQRYYTGFFSNENLDDALKSICVPMSLSYTIELPNRVVIK